MAPDLNTPEGLRAHYAGVKARISALDRRPQIAPPKSPVLARVYRNESFPAVVPALQHDQHVFAYLKHRYPTPTAAITPTTRIIAAVGRYYGFTAAEVLSLRKTARLVEARHVAIKLAHEMTDYSLPRLGRAFDRDHTSIMQTIRKMERPRFAALPALAHLRALLAPEAGTPTNGD